MDTLIELNHILPCRTEQLSFLGTIIDEVGCTIPAVFVYGHSATGKTSAVKLIVRHLKHTYVSINCVECYSPRLLFESILEHLDPQFVGRCDNANVFVNTLKKIVDKNYGPSHSIYIHFERAERLRDFGGHTLAMILRLQELSGLNIGVILESQIVWEKFRGETGFREPYIIHFPEYDRDHLILILNLDKPDECPADAYNNYIHVLLDVFHLVCRNLSELRYLAAVNYKKYVEPVSNGEACFSDALKLWKNVEPHLRKSLQTVYLREVSGDQWMKMEQMSSDSKMSLSKSVIELPVYTKYLLIAAYLASYNPAKSDKKLFVKSSSRLSKRSVLMAKKKEERTSCQILGPKFFPLDRLMAIFYSIIEDKVATSANTFSQIASLVTLGLLAQVSGADQFDNQKYKCLVTLDQIRSVSKSVGFEIMRYLYDFI